MSTSENIDNKDKPIGSSESPRTLSKKKRNLMIWWTLSSVVIIAGILLVLIWINNDTIEREEYSDEVERVEAVWYFSDPNTLEGELIPDELPNVDSTEITVGVMRVECAGGETGEIEDIDIEYTDDYIEITAYVEALEEGEYTCPSNNTVEHTIELDEPIGERNLVDGYNGEVRWEHNANYEVGPSEVRYTNGTEDNMPQQIEDEDHFDSHSDHDYGENNNLVVGDRVVTEVAGAEPRILLVGEEDVVVVDGVSFDVIATIDVGFDYDTEIIRYEDSRHAGLSTENGYNSHQILIDLGTWAVEHDDHNHYYTAAPYVYENEEFDDGMLLIGSGDYTVGNNDDTYSWFMDGNELTLLYNGEELNTGSVDFEIVDMFVAGWGG